MSKRGIWIRRRRREGVTKIAGEAGEEEKQKEQDGQEEQED